MMPTTRLIEVKAYLDPDIFDWMERERAQMRRTSKSQFMNLCVLERMERLREPKGPRPTHDTTRRRRSAA